MKNTIVNWVLWAAVIAINALANILPINGLNTGQISGFYPNYFVPAGFTFSIWGIIYLLLLTYTIAFGYYTGKGAVFPEITAYLRSITPYYWITCLLNGTWILAWHHLQIGLSGMLMLAFLLSLIRIFKLGLPYYKNFSSRQRTMIHAPFVVYMGWISVATIANITAWLVSKNWNGWNIEGPVWSVVMILIAVLLGTFMTLRFKISAYALVIAWALWGISKGQGYAHSLLKTVPLAGIVLLVVLSLLTMYANLTRKTVS